MKIDVSAEFYVFVFEREEKGPENDNWNFGVLAFLSMSKRGRFVTVTCFQKFVC